MVAFEPSTANAELVRRNVRANGLDQVLVSCRAVSSTTGVATLQVSAYSGGHSLDTAYEPPDLVDRLLVETVSIDDVVATPGRMVS